MADEEQREGLFEQIKSRIPDFHGYDEVAASQYEALSFYLAMRDRERMPQAQAAALTCENFGHDAPRGLCQRCGLGTELGLGKSDDDKQKRIAERDAFLRSRMRR